MVSYTPGASAIARADKADAQRSPTAFQGLLVMRPRCVRAGLSAEQSPDE